MKKINVLSLFDGISCGRLALERAGIQVDKYFASEIDKYAIQIAKKNYPDTIHIGSVTDVHYGQRFYGKTLSSNEGQWDDVEIDMIIGGSPCQDLSIAKKDGKGLQGEKSSLFFEYVRLLKEVRPKYFLLENVASMKKADRDTITEILGVEPIMINSALVSAQNRKRLYWFGQNRKREYNEDILCKHCFYAERGIQNQTSGKGGKEVLGETQEGQMNMQGVLSGVLENQEKMNSSDLQGRVCCNKQENEGQSICTEKQSKGTFESKGIQKDREVEELERGIQENRQMQSSYEKSGFKAGEKNNESYENARIESNNLTKEATIDGGSHGDTENEEVLCCVQCGKKLIHRPYNSTITRWNEGTRQFTDSLQELQFTETRQDDGGIFDTYTIGVEQPEDKDILLKDILEESVDEKLICKNITLIPGGEKKNTELKFIGGVRNKDWAKDGKSLSRNFSQGDRVYSPEGKSVSLSANGGGRGAKTGLYEVGGVALRNRGEGKRPEFNGQEKANSMTTVQADSMVAITPRIGQPQPYPRNYNELGLPRREVLEFRDDNKTNSVITNPMKNVLDDGAIIRKLTPIECERLQTLPDNWTEGISNTQRYKAIGNGWTVDVIAHIFSYIGK